MSESRLRVALTLDAEHPDRPHCPPEAADRVLDAFAEAGAVGTFFVQGRWAEAYPERAARIAADGHLVGNHSHYHARMPLLSDDGLRTDVEDARTYVMHATGADPRPWFRCPFGAGADDPRVLEALASLGYRHVHWHVEGGDWEPERTAEQIETDAVDGAVAHGDGAVVLLHTWPSSTAEALPGMIRRLRAAGAELVRLDELPEELLP